MFTIISSVTMYREVFTVTFDFDNYCFYYYVQWSVYCHTWCWQVLVLSLCEVSSIRLAVLMSTTGVTLYNEVFTVTLVLLMSTLGRVLSFSMCSKAFEIRRAALTKTINNAIQESVDVTHLMAVSSTRAETSGTWTISEIDPCCRVICELIDH